MYMCGVRREKAHQDADAPSPPERKMPCAAIEMIFSHVFKIRIADCISRNVAWSGAVWVFTQTAALAVCMY